MEKKIIEFIGEKVTYDDMGLYLWGNRKRDNGKVEQQMIAEVRGWGAIQNLFKGEPDGNKAALFQDAMGKFIADAITEKIERAKAASPTPLGTDIVPLEEDELEIIAEREFPTNGLSSIMKQWDAVSAKIGFKKGYKLGLKANPQQQTDMSEAVELTEEEIAQIIRDADEENGNSPITPEEDYAIIAARKIKSTKTGANDAVDYADWILNNEFEKDEDGLWVSYLWKAQGKEYAFEKEELYAIFKSETNKP